MRRRRYFTSHHPQQNLDSFLDILTNTVGVLMFISLFITLVTVQSSTIVRTPLATPTKKNAVFFEISDNRVIYLEKESVDRQIRDFINDLPDCDRPNYTPGSPEFYAYQLRRYEDCIQNRLARLQQFRLETKNYDIQLAPFGFVFNRKSFNNGESSKELAQTNSEYRQVLSELEPQKDYLAFIVRADSFAAFRKAREIAWEAGFDVGWEPQTGNVPITFGSGGRDIKVQ